MMMTIANKDRFPHIFALELLGGERSAEGEEYYEEHSDELQNEFSEIMKNVVVRQRLGDNKKIHVIHE